MPSTTRQRARSQRRWELTHNLLRNALLVMFHLCFSVVYLFARSRGKSNSFFCCESAFHSVFNHVEQHVCKKDSKTQGASCLRVSHVKTSKLLRVGTQILMWECTENARGTICWMFKSNIHIQLHCACNVQCNLTWMLNFNKPVLTAWHVLLNANIRVSLHLGDIALINNIEPTFILTNTNIYVIDKRYINKTSKNKHHNECRHYCQGWI